MQGTERAPSGARALVRSRPEDLLLYIASSDRRSKSAAVAAPSSGGVATAVVPMLTVALTGPDRVIIACALRDCRIFSAARRAPARVVSGSTKTNSSPPARAIQTIPWGKHADQTLKNSLQH